MTVRLARWIVTALLGALTGAAIAGEGARLAMRALAALTPTSVGHITDAGDTIGQITVGGTADILKVASVIGAAGAVLYLALRRALPASSLHRPLASAAVVVCLSMLPTVEGNRGDFRILPVGLAVIAFAVPAFLYGALTAAIVDRVIGPETRRFARRWQVALLALCLTAVMLNFAAFFASS